MTCVPCLVGQRDGAVVGFGLDAEGLAEIGHGQRRRGFRHGDGRRPNLRRGLTFLEGRRAIHVGPVTLNWNVFG